MKDKIEFRDFLDIESKLDIKVGKVIEAENVNKSDKLLKLIVDFGDEERICVTNIRQHLNMESQDRHPLINMSFLFIMNLNPVKMMGIESTVMIIPGDLENGKMVTINALPGTKVI